MSATRYRTCTSVSAGTVLSRSSRRNAAQPVEPYWHDNFGLCNSGQARSEKIAEWHAALECPPDGARKAPCRGVGSGVAAMTGRPCGVRPTPEHYVKQASGGAYVMGRNPNARRDTCGSTISRRCVSLRGCRRQRSASRCRRERSGSVRAAGARDPRSCIVRRIRPRHGLRRVG